MNINDVIHEKLFFGRGPVADYVNDMNAGMRVLEQIRYVFGYACSIQLDTMGLYTCVIGDMDSEDGQMVIMNELSEFSTPGEAICQAAISLFVENTGMTL